MTTVKRLVFCSKEGNPPKSNTTTSPNGHLVSTGNAYLVFTSVDTVRVDCLYEAAEGGPLVRVWLMKTCVFCLFRNLCGLLHPSRALYNSRSTTRGTWTAQLLALVYDFIDTVSQTNADASSFGDECKKSKRDIGVC